MGVYWISKEEEAAKIEKLYDKFLASVFWGLPMREPRYEDDLKLAYVKVEGKRVMIYVNNKDNKAYKMEGYELKIPLEEVKYDSFERWCTSFDV